MKILITGFDPFGGEALNPAWESVKRLPLKIEDAQIVPVEIPTVFNKSADILKEQIEMIQPEAVICVGQAGGRTAITPEKVAINLDDARIPDNENRQPVDKIIQDKGDTAYFSTLPVKAMVKAMRDQRIPAEVSYSAGTFVCNHVFYQLMHMLSEDYPELQGGFIHVPYIPQQTMDKPQLFSMSLDQITEGLQLCIQTVIERKGKGDIQAVGGTTH